MCHIHYVDICLNFKRDLDAVRQYWGKQKEQQLSEIELKTLVLTWAASPLLLNFDNQTTTSQSSICTAQVVLNASVHSCIRQDLLQRLVRQCHDNNQWYALYSEQYSNNPLHYDIVHGIKHVNGIYCKLEVSVSISMLVQWQAPSKLCDSIFSQAPCVICIMLISV